MPIHFKLFFPIKVFLLNDALFFQACIDTTAVFFHFTDSVQILVLDSLSFQFQLASTYSNYAMSTARNLTFNC